MPSLSNDVLANNLFENGESGELRKFTEQTDLYLNDEELKWIIQEKQSKFSEWPGYKFVHWIDWRYGKLWRTEVRVWIPIENHEIQRWEEVRWAWNDTSKYVYSFHGVPEEVAVQRNVGRDKIFDFWFLNDITQEKLRKIYLEKRICNYK